MLARAGDRGLTRDKVVSLLWPDADEERARRAITQALYALRQDLGNEEVIVGVKDLRLNPEMMSSDVSEFSTLIEAGELGRAAALYRGPFLDGFVLPGAAEFERWAEIERNSLAHEYAALLEQLAGQTAKGGDSAAAAVWWKKLAALDPLSARITLELMRAQAAAGDTAGALQQARIHQMLVDQELGLAPDRDIQALCDRLRQAATTPSTPNLAVRPQTQVGSGTVDEGGAGPAPSTAAPAAASPPPRAPRDSDARPSIAVTSGWATAGPGHVGPGAGAGVGAGLRPAPTEPAPARSSIRRIVPIAAGIAVVAAVAIGVRLWQHRPAAATGRVRPVVAVGRITSYDSPSGTDIGRPLSDMLATNLARSPDLTVVSAARMYELVLQGSATPDTSASGLLAAARQAGATELVDGSLYQMGKGRLRLDLRRVDLTSGSVRQAYTLEGIDLFNLADSGTARLLLNLGATGVSGSLADVTTKSVEAYRLYEEGVRDFYSLRYGEAEARLGEALKQDPAFAMAMFYFALSASPNRAIVARRLNQAVRLADGASDRERLLIKAAWAWNNSNPSLIAVAETMVVRYPKEVEGQYYLGIGRLSAGDFTGARGPLHDALAMDSLGLQGRNPGCFGCRALGALVDSYLQVDSLPGAQQIARLWTRLQPAAASSWGVLAEVESRMGHTDTAMAYEQISDSLDPTWGGAGVRLRPTMLMRSGEFGEADALLRPMSLGANSPAQSEARWQYAISLRNQGRLTEALALGRRHWIENAGRAGIADMRGAASPLRVIEAQVLFEQGHYSTAAALFDSIAAYRFTEEDSTAEARHRAWYLTHAATSYAAAGDSGRLQALRDSVQLLGAQSFQKRDHLLWFYIDGLLERARGRPSTAAEAFRSSIVSLPQGYTRANLELARTYLVLRKGREAVAVLQPVLRGPLEGSDLYVTLTEAHELLGQAWEDAGNADSAAAHYHWAVNALAQADPDRIEPREEMKKRLVALGR
jgi:DNA-binding SARP family transcriptional activator/predicted Zn-dependent protease